MTQRLTAHRTNLFTSGRRTGADAGPGTLFAGPATTDFLRCIGLPSAWLIHDNSLILHFQRRDVELWEDIITAFCLPAF